MHQTLFIDVCELTRRILKQLSPAAVAVAIFKLGLFEDKTISHFSRETCFPFFPLPSLVDAGAAFCAQACQSMLLSASLQLLNSTPDHSISK